MKKQRLLILGAAGFIGRALTERLESEYEITAVDIRPIKNFRVSSVVLDLARPVHVRSWLKREREPYFATINLAAYYDFENRWSERYEGLLRGLEVLARDLPTRYFLQASSMASLVPGHNLDSQSPRMGSWTYPLFKLQCEEILRSHAPFPVTELVLAGVYSDWCELVPLFQFIELHRKFSLPRWFYPGDARRTGLTFLHRSDLIQAIEILLRMTLRPSRVLLGEPRFLSWADIHSAADRKFHQLRLPKLRVPRWCARLGAHGLRCVGYHSFYQPWMIDYSDEVFTFAAAELARVPGFHHQNSIRKELPRILDRALKQSETWYERNHRRAWRYSDWDL